MDKSNDALMPLTHEHASRLVQLFAPSFDDCLTNYTEKSAKPIVWHPVLKDIHEQVVHALSPVLIESRQHLGDSSPTLSLSLLAPPVTATRLQAIPRPHVIPDELIPAVKTSL